MLYFEFKKTTMDLIFFLKSHTENLVINGLIFVRPSPMVHHFEENIKKKKKNLFQRCE